jgi:hypothetical protein
MIAAASAIGSGAIPDNFGCRSKIEERCMRTMNRLPANGTKDRAKLEAMIRLGPLKGAETRELQAIDGNGGWGTYKNDGHRYAVFLKGKLHISGEGASKRYWIELSSSSPKVT